MRNKCVLQKSDILRRSRCTARLCNCVRLFDRTREGDSEWEDERKRGKVGEMNRESKERE
jgi:hypothetical protein